MKAPDSLAGLPAWPRHLSREEAARYVGVSASVFGAEVAAGEWPPPRRRGGKGGRATWDIRALDAAADRASGLAVSASAPVLSVGNDAVDEEWNRRISGAAGPAATPGTAGRRGKTPRS